jgi:hypothetical protein
MSEAVKVKKRRRFSSDSLNDLLFWGVQLCLLAIALAILWSKLDNTAAIMAALLRAQEREVEMVRRQALDQQAAAELARQAEHTRSIQFSTALRTLETVQADVKDTLAKTQETNGLVLQAIEVSKAAALQAASKASNAAGAAQQAAAASSRTGSVVASKVATTYDKRQVDAQKAALARKQAQLSRTIKQVKKNGPNLIQQIFK